MEVSHRTVRRVGLSLMTVLRTYLPMSRGTQRLFLSPSGIHFFSEAYCKMPLSEVVGDSVFGDKTRFSLNPLGFLVPF